MEMQEKRLPKSPIFIGGLFKSGTSLLRAMLGQHSAIATGLETYWFDIDWDAAHDGAFHERIERLRKFYGLEKGITERIIARSESPSRFLSLFLGHYTDSMGKKRWAEKTPGNILHLDKIYSEWPDAKVIHVVRDPRDVFASSKQARKWDRIDKFSGIWSLFLGSSEGFKRKLSLDNKKYLEIRYENLAIFPRETMKMVISFLDESWEESVAEFKGREDDYHKVFELTGKESSTLNRLRQPLSTKRVGIWHEIVSQDEIEKIHNMVEREGLLPLITKIEEETPQFA